MPNAEAATTVLKKQLVLQLVPLDTKRNQLSNPGDLNLFLQLVLPHRLVLSKQNQHLSRYQSYQLLVLVLPNSQETGRYRNPEVRRVYTLLEDHEILLQRPHTERDYSGNNGTKYRIGIFLLSPVPGPTRVSNQSSSFW